MYENRPFECWVPLFSVFYPRAKTCPSTYGKHIKPRANTQQLRWKLETGQKCFDIRPRAVEIRSNYSTLQAYFSVSIAPFYSLSLSKSALTYPLDFAIICKTCILILLWVDLIRSNIENWSTSNFGAYAYVHVNLYVKSSINNFFSPVTSLLQPDRIFITLT